MSKRKFYLYDFLQLKDFVEGNYERQQTGPATCYIFFEHDGKTWRIDEKTNTDGEDELWQSIQYSKRHKTTEKPEDGYAWEATEVKLVEVLVKKFVPVKD